MQKVKAESLELLFEQLLGKYKIDLSGYATASLERRIERFLSMYRFESQEAFSTRLLSDKVFFDLFVKEITVNTTEMFRDPECWKVIREEVIPQVADHPTIRIWHAGCSSGEEVYSMAILLKEAGLLGKAKIIASDLNRDVMQTAAEGVYSMKTLAINEENYFRSGGTGSLLSYLETDNPEFRMNRELIQDVRFMKHDLSTGAPFSKFDIILCRNVMIYFNKALQEKVFGIFHQSLFKRGFVVIGKKESMTYYTGVNSFAEFNMDEKIYQLK